MDINNIPKEILDQIPPEFLDNLDQLMQETRKPVSVSYTHLRAHET